MNTAPRQVSLLQAEFGDVGRNFCYLYSGPAIFEVPASAPSIKMRQLRIRNNDIIDKISKTPPRREFSEIDQIPRKIQSLQIF